MAHRLLNWRRQLLLELGHRLEQRQERLREHRPEPLLGLLREPQPEHQRELLPKRLHQITMAVALVGIVEHRGRVTACPIKLIQVFLHLRIHQFTMQQTHGQMFLQVTSLSIPRPVATTPSVKARLLIRHTLPSHQFMLHLLPSRR